jgi:hypothetical protein
MTPDARFVVFGSEATNLVPGDTNGVSDIFIRDRLSGITERISLSTAGTQANAASGWASVSADGRYVAYYSSASNLVAGDFNGVDDVFVRDRLNALTVRVSVSSSGGAADQVSYGGSISGDGRYVAFVSSATNLVAGDTNGMWDVFVRDRQLSTTERVSVGPGGIQSDGSSSPPFISENGRYVTFRSAGTTLVPGITAGGVFVRDLRSNTTEYSSASTAGAQPNGTCIAPSISSGGRYVIFRGFASNLVPNDTKSLDDIFLHDRLASGFTSQCEPANAGVLACPCNNSPSGSGRGCDNSSFTGGAALGASGIAYLSLDSLAFSTSGEKTSATSILLLGDTSIPTGAGFGQGVRCAGGTLKRLFVKTAVNGSITAPDLAAGDPTVSARSAALGAPIQAGLPYFYLVYYRDPIVLGGCSATQTFNCTQTAQISWWP